MKNRLNILVADDNKHFLNAFQYILFDGFGEKIETLFTAVSGKEALKILGDTSIDLVFMDVEMHGQSGIETTKKILAKYKSLVVVALSFHVESNYVNQMKEAGAKWYVEKENISKDELQLIFDRYL